MELIIMMSRTGHVRRLRLRKAWFWVGVPAILGATLLLLSALIWGVVSTLPAAREAVLWRLLTQSTAENRVAGRAQDRLAAFSDRLALLQSQVWQLQAQNVALAKSAGLLLPSTLPAVVGEASEAKPRAATEKSLRPNALTARLDTVQTQLRATQIEHALLQDWIQVQTRQNLDLPSQYPLNGGHFTSNFGPRSDPFTRRTARHDGIDFASPKGTDILAAGAGNVIFAAYHAGYGNLVEIDHGNGISSRYAHASQLLVHMGDHVEAGALIAKVGSTGRSTGAHLHFEVRIQGVAQNPGYLFPFPTKTGGEKDVIEEPFADG